MAMGAGRGLAGQAPRRSEAPWPRHPVAPAWPERAAGPGKGVIPPALSALTPLIPLTPFPDRTGPRPLPAAVARAA